MEETDEVHHLRILFSTISCTTELSTAGRSAFFALNGRILRLDAYNLLAALYKLYLPWVCSSFSMAALNYGCLPTPNKTCLSTPNTRFHYILGGIEIVNVSGNGQPTLESERVS